MNNRQYPPNRDPYHNDWDDEPRRRLNSKGVSLLLFLGILVIPLFFSTLKLGWAFWNSPVGSQAAKSAERLGSVAADVALDEYGVPAEVRTAVKEEAGILREAAAGNQSAENPN